MANLFVTARNKVLAAIWAKMPPKVLATVALNPSWGGSPDDDYSWYEQAYQNHGHVFTCVKILSEFAGQIPLRVQKKVAIGGRLIHQAQPKHPTQLLFDRPNPYLSAFDLKKYTLAYLELTGNCYWYLVKQGNATAEIWILRPDRVTIVPDKKKGVGISGYVYRAGADPIPFLPEEIIHFKYFNPYDDYYGMSTLRAAKKTLSQDVYAEKWNLNFFKNSATPPGGLKFETTLTPEEFERINERWNKYHRGVDKAHNIAVFEKGSDWVNMGIPQKDMEFLESQKFNQRKIGSIFGLVPVLMNDYERANYNNARTQIQFFTNITMVPKILNLEGALNRSLPDLSGGTYSSDLSVSFAISEIWAMKQDEQVRTSIEQIQIQTGRRTINEIRTENNEDPVPWGDTWYMPMGVVPYDGEGGNGENGNGNSQGARSLLNLPVITPVQTRADFRRAEAKAFGVVLTKRERQFRKFLVEVFNDQKREVVRKLRAYARTHAHARAREDITTKLTEIEIESILFSLEEAIKELGEISESLYEAMVKDGGEKAFRLAGIQGTFDLTDPRAQAIIAKATQRFAKKINSTTWNRLKDSLVAGAKEGETIIALADRVEQIMQHRIRSDKWTIARTEVMGALNGGAEVGMAEAGVETKEWAAAGDEATRESHMDVDGQVVALNSPFIFEGMEGGTVEMLYPGDPSGPPEEVINCRCTIIPGIQEAPKE